MQSEKVEKFLIERGYKKEMHGEYAPEYVAALYYRVAYGESAPDCLCNDEPPQFCVQDAYFPPTSAMPEGYRSFSIYICNEAPQGWADFKFYALGEEEILTKFAELERALLTAWSALFPVN